MQQYTQASLRVSKRQHFLWTLKVGGIADSKTAEALAAVNSNTDANDKTTTNTDSSGKSDSSSVNLSASKAAEENSADAAVTTPDHEGRKASAGSKAGDGLIRINDANPSGASSSNNANPDQQAGFGPGAADEQPAIDFNEYTEPKPEKFGNQGAPRLAEKGGNSQKTRKISQRKSVLKKRLLKKVALDGVKFLFRDKAGNRKISLEWKCERVKFFTALARLKGNPKTFSGTQRGATSRRGKAKNEANCSKVCETIGRI